MPLELQGEAAVLLCPWNLDLKNAVFLALHPWNIRLDDRLVVTGIKVTPSPCLSIVDRRWFSACWAVGFFPLDVADDDPHLARGAIADDLLYFPWPFKAENLAVELFK